MGNIDFLPLIFYRMGNLRSYYSEFVKFLWVNSPMPNKNIIYHF